MIKQRIETHLHTEFSFLDGVSSPKEYVERAKELNMPALAITDHGLATGIIDFYEACTKGNIIPLIGIELYIAFDKTDVKHTSKGDKLNRSHVIVIAKNEIGLKNLYKLASKGWENETDNKAVVLLEDLFELSEGLVCTSACIASIVQDEATAEAFKEVFKDDFYLEIQPLLIDKDYDFKVKVWNPLEKNKQEDFNIKILEIAKKLNIKVITTADVHYARKEDKTVQDVVIANSQIGKTGWNFGTTNHYLMGTDEFWEEFKKYGHDKYFTYEEYIRSIDNSYEIIEKCKNVKVYKDQILKKFPIESHRFYSEGDTAKDLLFKVVENNPRLSILNEDAYLDRFNYELDVLESKGFIDYFLIVEDIINFSNKNDILVGPGRGSVGGSLVAYLMDIHQVDPIKFGCLFERFIDIDAPKGYIPDIDSDFSDSEAVKRYIEEKYGKDYVALGGCWQESKLKTSLKDAYRILRPEGSFLEINKLCSTIKSSGAEELSETDFYLNMIKEDSETYNKQLKEFIDKSPDIHNVILKVLGKRKCLKMHPCSVMISTDPIDELVPTFLDEGVKTVQYPGDHCEKSGLVKFDILSLSILNVVKDCVSQIEPKIDIYNLPLDDEKTLKAFADGDTDKVHTFNTPLFQKWLKEIRVDSFHDLVVANAIVRPGPLESKFPEIYCARKRGILGLRDSYDENGHIVEVPYSHPILDEITKDTRNLVLYQEQVMQIYGKIGGFTPSEQNKMRKALSKKKLDIIQEAKAKVVKYATTELNPPMIESEASAMMDDVENFAKYSFNVAHSCFSEDQEVQTDCGIKKFKDLIGNEDNFKVASRNMETLEKEYINPKKVFVNGIRDLYRIKLSDGSYIESTLDHELLTESGWMSVEEIFKEGKNIDCIDKSLKIESMEKIRTDLVYDMDIPGNHNFILGNGIVAHNCEYSLLGYICQYLKVNYPTQWWGSVLKNATENDVNITLESHPEIIGTLDINVSKSDFYLNDGKYAMPFKFLRGIGDSCATEIISHQPFANFKDFYTRINKTRVRANNIFNLIISGCFKSIEGTKTELELIKEYTALSGKPIPPEMKDLEFDSMVFEKIKCEINPFYKFNVLDKFKDVFSKHTRKISTIRSMHNGDVILGGFIKNVENKLTKTNNHYIRFTLDDGENSADIYCWENSFKRCQEFIKENSIVEIKGKINVFNKMKTVILNDIICKTI